MFQFSGYPIVLRTQNQNLKFYIVYPVKLRSNLFGVTLRFACPLAIAFGKV